MVIRDKSKNIPEKKLSLLERKEKLEKEIQALEIDIGRPQKFKDALRKETEFGEVYLNMTDDEKKQIQSKYCDYCFKFMDWKPTSDGRMAPVPSDMESFASFFGNCECMWKRYVARNYRPRYMDPFDMNNYRKLERYTTMAQTALNKKAIAQEQLDSIIHKLAVNEHRRKLVEASKESCVVDEEMAKKRLGERRIQAEKNKHKMERARAITTMHSTNKRRRRRGGQGNAKKQNSV